MNSKPTFMPPAQVDIIIPIYGKLEFLEKCLQKLTAAAGGVTFQVCAFDNASPKVGAQEIVEKAFPRALFRRSRENLGFPKGCNAAFRMGHAPLVMFLNTDCFLEPNSIQIMVEDLIMDNQIGAVGPKLLFPEDCPHGKFDRVQHAGLDTNINGEIIHTFIGWSKDNERVNKLDEPLALTGACLLTRRILFREAGMFLEDYKQGTYEDVDYCLTLRNSNYKIIYEPRAVGYHYVGASAVENKIAYPLNQNYQLFRLRWNNKIPWTEWTRL